ncbi:glycoside hydrolase family 15 protein [Nocardioides sp. ChNu-153]|uniref:glycoside hydrolase family 15 protein n=1 Tax=unclassified Nocardioides TaxID=2615069 RepID=UPI0024069F80|nr:MULTISPECIES: glycoside hydrolase family 15 protein [unclassified Nocardioides]MDF9715194.1 glycoside hydrolase family 15 protein [Nocardioides sp. ChNu-99]MDN7121027.1 glycoside hydrolase family 15 protein [Nocardioides sp. ChNu-153]
MTEEARTDRAPDIAAHGLIGDLRSCALVSTDGTIDWFCPGRFDAPSIFAALLDPEVGGAWTLRPTGEVTRTQQYYLPDTAILVTRFLTPQGVVEVQDFMPVLRPHDDEHRQRVVRRVSAVRGAVPFVTRVQVRHDYGREDATPTQVEGGISIPDGHVDLVLSSTHDLVIDGGVVVADVELAEGETALFVLEVLAEGAEPVPCAVDDTASLLDRTTSYWRGWLASSSYAGRWRGAVERSAITLKLMCHEPSGGVIASPTTSLPEEIGGERNWDYRFVWIRDAAFTLYGLLRLGFTDEAAAFTAWLSRRIGEADRDDPTYERLGPLRVLYDLDGKVPVEEHELDHLAGHRGSRPVRVGNAAVDQLQLDIYGELVDSVYLFDKYGAGISHDGWSDLCTVLEWVMDNWDRDDHGMWEIRQEPRPHTTSRLMCWVAVERMIRVARRRGLPGDIAAWGKVRDEIYERVMAESWDPDLESFTQAEGSRVLDAGLLLMPLVKFTAPGDPRFLSTLDAIEEHLVTDSLVFRYDPEAQDSHDGLDGAEGTFSMCSFWYVEALTRAGRVDDARLAFEKMLTYGNHLGLFAEQVGLTGEQLGNFPQAFTHLSLISAATNLDRALG